MIRLMKKSFGALLVASLFVVLHGCGGGGAYTPVRTNFVEFSDSQKLEINSSKENQYRITPNDVLQIVSLDQPELQQESILVLPDGAVTLIGLDRLKVSGMTVTEADSMITKMYSRTYLHPDISVIVREVTGLQVYVLGEVNRPGMQKLNRGGLGIVGAVTLAGGFTENASEGNAVLVRVSEEGYMVQEVDLSQFYEPESFELAMIELHPNDVVYVPRSKIGDFAYFSKTILAGLVNITRLASDLKYLSTGTYGRF